MHHTQQQIERHRKGDALIQVQDQDDQPCAQARVSVEQQTHQFSFGCVISNLNDWSTNDRQRYNRRVAELFNVVRRQEEAHQVGAESPTVDLTNCRERMHMAQIQRELDKLNIATKEEKGTAPRVTVNVSGSTVGLCDHPRGDVVHAEDEPRFAQRVAELYTLCFSHSLVQGIYWCGVSDGETGVRNGGLLRRDLSPKNAHKTLRKLINTIWHTRDHGETDTRGQFRFRGFFGTYRVIVAMRDRDPVLQRLRLADGPDQSMLTVRLGCEEPTES